MTSRLVTTGWTGWFPALLLMVTLAGCEAMPGYGKRGAVMTESGSSASTTGGMDKGAMCERHRKMMSAQSTDERNALMDERMRSMSPEMLHQQIKMMQQHCAQ